jgi:predicted Zn-dependent protease
MGSGDRVIRAALVVLMCAFVLAAAAGTAGGPQPAAAAPQLESAKGPVLFVPLGSFPRGDATKLARYVRARLGVETGVLSRGSIPRSAFNAERKQHIAEVLVDSLLTRRPAGSPQAILIGLTVEDMYAKFEAFRFTFSIRNPRGFAVVSRARMDPRRLGLVPDPALRTRRLQKMVLKNVNSLAFGRSLSGNPRSVMFGSILSADDLDYMTEDVRPEAPSRATRTWLRESNGVCNRAVSREKAFIDRSKGNTAEEVFAFAPELLDLREQQRSELAALSPPADRAAFRALLTRFGKANTADRQAVAALQARWSEEGFIRWLTGRVKVGLALKAAALELGSRACGRYFDPLTYG